MGEEVLVIGVTNLPFAVAIAVRGFESLLLDQMTDPALAHRLVRVTTDSLQEHARELKEYPVLEVVLIEDGIADETQNDLANSLAFESAYEKQLADRCHELGVRMIVSNCAAHPFKKEQ